MSTISGAMVFQRVCGNKTAHYGIMNTENHFSPAKICMLLGLALGLVLVFACVPAHAAVWPEDQPEYNSMKIDYTISGVSIDSSSISMSESFDWWKHLKGKVTGKTVTVSGTVTGHNEKKGSTTEASVSVSAGSRHAEQIFHSSDDPYGPYPSWKKPFKVTINVPDDAKTVEVSISESVFDGQRGMGVQGTFTNPSYNPNAKPSSSSPSSSSDSGGNDLPLLPIAAVVVLIGGGALALKMMKGRSPLPVTQQPPPNAPSVKEPTTPVEPYVPPEEDINPEIPGIENDPDAEIFTSGTPDKEQQEYVNHIIQNVDPGDLEKLTKSGWEKLSDQKREDMIQKLRANIAKELGVKNPPLVTLTTTLPEGLDSRALGWYDANTHPPTIAIRPDTDNFKSPESVILTLGHEMKHAQQGDPGNPMENKQARNLVDKNTANYNESTVDYNRYAKQYKERDANTMGKKLATQVSKNAYSKKLDNLADLINQLKPDPRPPSHGGFDTIDKIKNDPDGFLQHLNNNPDQKESFTKIVKQNAQRMKGGR